MDGWTDTRLARLYERYRLLYWPRSRRLRSFRVRDAALGKLLGLCDYVAHVLTVDVGQHPSDQAVRATLLHEMIHAVVGHRKGHGVAFWTQLEYWLYQGFPNGVST